LRVRVQTPTSERLIREHYTGMVGSRSDTPSGRNTTDGGGSNHRKHAMLPIPNRPPIIGSPASDASASSQNTGVVSPCAYSHGVGNASRGERYIGSL
jgi:hypothetical protein